MKTKLTTTIACAAAMLTGALWADTEKVDGYTWTYQIVNGKAEIRNSTTTAVSPKPKKACAIPAKLGGKPVAVLGANALYQCTEMTSVTIPSTVTTLEAGVFKSCTKLRSVKIPDAVTSIGDSAFASCSALQCVEFGKKVDSIGGSEFTSCSKLHALVFKGNAPSSIKANTFSSVPSYCSAYVPKSAKGWPATSDDDPATWQGMMVFTSAYMTQVEVNLYDASMAGLGTVSGTGMYPVGKKVTLKATPAKNCVFGGWIEKNSKEELGFSASYSYTVTGAEDEFLAIFATAAEDADTLYVQVDDFTTDADGSVYKEIPITSISEPKVTFKNLPSGVKFDAAKRVLTGKATKPGKYLVSVSVTNKSTRQPDTDEFEITVPNIKDTLIPVEDSYGEFIPGAFSIWTIPEAEGCSVSGLPPGMKWTAKATVDSKTKTNVPANSVYGAPTKSGEFTVFFTKTVNKEKHTATSTFVVDSFRVLSLSAETFGAKSLSGGGAYLANAKVKLKAQAEADYVFSGWYEAGEGGARELLSRTPNYEYEMPLTDAFIYARFVTKGEDAANVKTKLEVAGKSYGLENNAEVQVKDDLSCGVYYQLPLTVTALSETTVKVTGLPSGLKFTAKDIMVKGSKTEVEVPANTIYGVPTKAAESFYVKVQVTTAGKASFAYGLYLGVNALEPWAVGQFDGAGKNGPVTFTVANNGKISGKYMANGETWSFAAPYFDAYAGTYTATVSGKKGNETFSETLTIHEPKTPMGEKVARLSGDATLGEMELYQTFWKFDAWKAAGKAINKQVTGYTPVAWTYDDTVLLTFSANGTVKTSGTLGGYKPSGTATLIPEEMPADGTGAFRAWLYVYFPPNLSKGFPGYFEDIHLLWDGSGFAFIPKN